MLCGHFPSVEEFGGVSPSVGGLGHQHLRCPYAHFCTFFVVHYVSHFNYSSSYYSSSYVVSSGLSSVSSVTVAPSLTGFPVFLDQHGMVPPPPLMPRGSGRCDWLSFCATGANSIFNASFSLCQLCYGFSTGRFLFQS